MELAIILFIAAAALIFGVFTTLKWLFIIAVIAIVVAIVRGRRVL